MSEENNELVRRAYAALAGHDPLGDWSWFLDDFAHDDLELRPAATGLDATSSYKRPPRLVAVLAGLLLGLGRGALRP
jgi:hypothetical protein